MRNSSSVQTYRKLENDVVDELIDLLENSLVRTEKRVSFDEIKTISTLQQSYKSMLSEDRIKRIEHILEIYRGLFKKDSLLFSKEIKKSEIEQIRTNREQNYSIVCIRKKCSMASDSEMLSMKKKVIDYKIITETQFNSRLKQNYGISVLELIEKFKKEGVTFDKSELYLTESYAASSEMKDFLQYLLKELPTFNIEFLLMKRFSELVKNNSTPHLLLPVRSFMFEKKSTTTHFLLAEYTNGGNLEEFIRQYRSEITTDMLKQICYKVLYTLCCIKKENEGFRHNQLSPFSIYVHIYENDKTVIPDSNTYLYKEKVIVLPRIKIGGGQKHIEIYVGDFDSAEILSADDNSFLNLLANDADKGIINENVDYYDIHCFLNSLLECVKKQGVSKEEARTFLEWTKRYRLMDDAFLGKETAIEWENKKGQTEKYSIVHNFRLSSDLQYEYIMEKTYDSQTMVENLGFNDCIQTQYRALFSEMLRITSESILDGEAFNEYLSTEPIVSDELTYSYL